MAERSAVERLIARCHDMDERGETFLQNAFAVRFEKEEWGKFPEWAATAVREQLGGEVTEALMHDLLQAVEAIRGNAEAAFTTRYVPETADVEQFLEYLPIDAGKREILSLEKAVYLGAESLIRLINGVEILFEGSITQEALAPCNPFGLAFKYKKLLATDCRRHEISLYVTSFEGTYTLPERRLGVILWSYLSNAIKYGPRGSQITVSLSESSAGALRVEVSSLGPKIAQDETSSIFRLRVRGRFAGKVPGSRGFGLGIVSAASRGWCQVGVHQAEHSSRECNSPPLFPTTFWVETLPFGDWEIAD